MGVFILSVTLLLLTEINQNQQRSSQSNNQQALKHSLVEIEVQVVIVAILVAFRFQGTIFIILPPLLFVKIFVIALLVVLDESLDPFFEGAAGFRVCGQT